MRENRTYGSEGGGTGYSTGPSYPYLPGFSRPLTRGEPLWLDVTVQDFAWLNQLFRPYPSG